jgi:hypothetical protein
MEGESRGTGRERPFGDEEGLFGFHSLEGMPRDREGKEHSPDFAARETEGMRDEIGGTRRETFQLLRS